MNKQFFSQLNNKGFNIVLSSPVAKLTALPIAFTPEQMNKSLCLIGSGGKMLWEKIPNKSLPDPIDHYTVDVINELGDVEILYPNEQYLLPLQKLGRHFNLSHQSPIGLDISKEFGLWFAFRGVFLIDQRLPESIMDPWPSPCDTCAERPCLNFQDVNQGRLHCPYKTEHQYVSEQRDYHLRILKQLKTTS